MFKHCGSRAVTEHDGDAVIAGLRHQFGVLLDDQARDAGRLEYAREILPRQPVPDDDRVVIEPLTDTGIQRAVDRVRSSEQDRDPLGERPGEMYEEGCRHHGEHGCAEEQLIVAVPEQPERQPHGSQEERELPDLCQAQPAY